MILLWLHGFVDFSALYLDQLPAHSCVIDFRRFVLRTSLGPSAERKRLRRGVLWHGDPGLKPRATRRAPSNREGELWPRLQMGAFGE